MERGTQSEKVFRVLRHSNNVAHRGGFWTSVAGKAFSVLLAVVMVATVFGVVSFGAKAGGTTFQGYDTSQSKWQGANLGDQYSEGDWVSYQLKIDTSSPIWGASSFDVKFRFYDASPNAVYVDGFDISASTGFQYKDTTTLLTDSQMTPPADWGTDIPVPAAGEVYVSGPKIDNYMQPYPAGSNDGSPVGTAPDEYHYFSISGLPWGSFSSGSVVIFWRCHLALTIIWHNGLEANLPQQLDGNFFNTWTAKYWGSSEASGSSRNFQIEYPGVGQLTVPIPIADYPSTLLSGHKYVGGALFNGWSITLTGMLDLGPNLPAILYNPPVVYTGQGTYAGGTTWSIGYFEFTGLATGFYTVTEQNRAGFGHYDIVVGGAATNIVENVAQGWASLNLAGGSEATVDFYNKAATHTSTQLSASSITLGQSVTDTATVTASGAVLTGDVQFYVKADAGSWLPLGGPVALVNGQATSISYTPMSAGSYWFMSSYPGSPNFGSSQSNETDEPLTVGPAKPTTTTLLSASSITLGGTVHDTVTVTGLGGSFPMPAGTVQFYVKVGVGSWAALGAPVILVNGQATSIDYTPLAAGSYWFKAMYSGDANYVSASSGETDEPLTAGPAKPTAMTLLSATSITFGQSVHDNVTVVGLGGAFPMPTGTVQFYVKVGNGTWEPLGAPVQLVSGKATSINYTPSAGGSYWFMAIYSGDSNYVGARSGETAEPLTVTSTVTRTLGYWKNHASKWVGLNPNDKFPWTTGRAAGKTYMQILNLQPDGDASIILAQQYIAAKLNANAFDAPQNVSDEITHAGYLFSHGYPVGSNPPNTDSVRAEMIALAGVLDDYNNSGDT